MNLDQLNTIWESLFDLKINLEDSIELNRNGFPHGYKKGVVERKLKQCEKALELVQTQIDTMVESDK